VIFIVLEVTGKERGRIYAYTKYLEILDEGTDPINIRLKRMRFQDARLISAKRAKVEKT